MGRTSAVGAGLAGRADPNDTYRLGERFWVSYSPDAAALGLFRLDSNVSVDEAMENALGEAFEDDEAGLVEVNDGGNVKDDTELRPRNAQADGEVEWIREGVFKGAARFVADGNPRIVTPAYPELVNGHAIATVEAWFNPAADAESEMILFNWPMRDGRDVDVLRLADGRVRLTRGGATLGDSAETWMPANAWRHVALVCYWAEESDDPVNRIHRPIAPGVRVLVHGHPVIDVAGKDQGWLWQFGRELYWIGNNPAGDNPLAGLVDEIRVSRTARRFPVAGTALFAQGIGVKPRILSTAMARLST